MARRVNGTPEERFWDKVNKSTLSGCWEWMASRMPNRGRNQPYGRFRVGDTIVFAHRWAYRTFVGPIPEGMHVMHQCDNPTCVRPDHLEVGTPKENSADMVRKGRSARGKRGELVVQLSMRF